MKIYYFLVFSVYHIGLIYIYIYSSMHDHDVNACMCNHYKYLQFSRYFADMSSSVEIIGYNPATARIKYRNEAGEAVLTSTTRLPFELEVTDRVCTYLNGRDLARYCLTCRETEVGVSEIHILLSILKTRYTAEVEKEARADFHAEFGF